MFLLRSVVLPLCRTMRILDVCPRTRWLCFSVLACFLIQSCVQQQQRPRYCCNWAHDIHEKCGPRVMSSDDDLGDESEVEHGHQSDKAPSSDDDSSDESSEESELVVDKASSSDDDSSDESSDESELVVDKASSDNEVEPLSNDDGQVQDDEVDRLADIDAAAVRLLGQPVKTGRKHYVLKSRKPRAFQGKREEATQSTLVNCNVALSVALRYL